MTRLTKKIIKELDYQLMNMIDYDSMDNEVALAWHPALGLLVGEWMNQITDYAKQRDRKFFFGVNNYGMPSVFFDCEDKWELNKLMEQKRVSDKFANPRKSEPNQFGGIVMHNFIAKTGGFADTELPSLEIVRLCSSLKELPSENKQRRKL